MPNTPALINGFPHLQAEIETMRIILTGAPASGFPHLQAEIETIIQANILPIFLKVSTLTS